MKNILPIVKTKLTAVWSPGSVYALVTEYLVLPIDAYSQVCCSLYILISSMVILASAHIRQ